MNIFIYGIIFRDMGDFECYMGDFECYMGYFECYMGYFEYIITNLVLIFFFNSLSCKTQSWQNH